MLTEKIKKYLEENADLVLPKYQINYKKKLQELNFNERINSSFIDFMVKYSDEYYGEEGLISDVMNDDLMDYENGLSKHLIDNYGVSEKYISLSNLESDDYLLYNKEDDSVKLIESQNIKELSNDKYYDKKWDSFNEFLEYFFELE
ncbi:hypothetical protein EQP59_07300 [Ornithobacterium rhinotracheale]|uniref:SMI1/KNR4 family protein n=1 Tax=Ornithobacterium rhinotracheale TaxID=28251 RepID=A0A3R5XU18_ORNRH|nr:hypothetical protein [Ornithobacterium rhinotracheale]QAR31151.1 hypothetical protein EQP59_07300 [Ornithobacterium rhinotracheale]